MKKIIRNTAIVIGTYMMLNISFQYGKAYIINLMKENDLTVDETIKCIEYSSKYGPCKMNNFFIRKCIAKTKD